MCSVCKNVVNNNNNNKKYSHSIVWYDSDNVCQLPKLPDLSQANILNQSRNGEI